MVCVSSFLMDIYQPTEISKDSPSLTMKNMAAGRKKKIPSDTERTCSCRFVLYDVNNVNVALHFMAD